MIDDACQNGGSSNDSGNSNCHWNTVISTTSDSDEGNLSSSSEFLEALIHHSNAKKQGSAFLEKLYDILMDDQYESYISWCADGKSILIKKVEDFSQIVLPKFYKHNNFQSFVRQLNMYNFTKTSHDANRREFRQPLFGKGKRNLLPLICRKTQKAMRSTDNNFDGIDTNDLCDAALSYGEMQDGNSLVRMRSIDSSSHVSVQSEKESLPPTSPIWAIVHELRMRVTALEEKIQQISTKSDLKNILKSNNPCQSNTAEERISKNNSDNSNTERVSSPKDDEVSIKALLNESFVHSKTRCRSISSSSYESFDSFENKEDRSEPQSPRMKRGVDAILSAAEILHDVHSAPLSLQNNIVKMAAFRMHSSVLVQTDTKKSSKKLRSCSKEKSVNVMDSSNSKIDSEGLDIQSDSSSSPLYFQENEENRHRTRSGERVS